MSYPLRESRPADPFARIPPELGARLRPLVPSLAEEALEGIRRRAEFHAAPLEPADAEGLRRTVEAGLLAFLDRVEGDRSPGHADALAAEFRAFGAGEARHGRTLECLHTGMRTAAAVAWRRLAGADALTRDHMAVLGEAIFAFQEEVSTAAAEGHARVRGAGADALRRRRARLVEVLLAETGARREEQAVPALARAARWRLPERVAVALLYRGTDGAAAPMGPADPSALTQAAVGGPSADALSASTGAFSHLSALPSDVLVGLDRVEPCAVVPDPEGPGRLRSLERSLRGSCAVLGPSVPLEQASLSLARARDLAELVRTGVVPGGGVVRWDDHLPALLLSRDPGLVAEMTRSRLAPLAPLRPSQRERMADTLLSWLESGLNANEAAERLRIHPQTVRYRLRQLEELFGERLREPGERFELELALRARRLLGPLEEGAVWPGGG
ncbi:helix-turn-helix domain-containing protein [Nocardiopsis dassonvillei]|uniref:helix-turn-helix domain-containing protein n=1 Tax=Nocardiopsis dassonvillei TaxID=2014 RepID=UPI00102B4167|nr:helix-turn-helix domain-containing protein [Nocardiopsis dassonvillei]MCP3013678.1 helix-turn-helix domain-containing protein [Nocardiopsis dassonvillei]